MATIFNDRAEAGRELARSLSAYAGRDDATVLALPRGGVPVGFEVATALGLPLDVLVVRKLGAPYRPELAVGAIARGGVVILDEPLIQRLGISPHEIVAEANAARVELERREQAYRRNAPAQDLEGKLAILVDDGLATGSTMKAAIEGVRRLGAQQVVVAVPVAPAATCRAIENLVDDLVCLHSPEVFESVGECYGDFSQLGDEEVQELLAEAHNLVAVAAAPPVSNRFKKSAGASFGAADYEPDRPAVEVQERQVRIPGKGFTLEGDLEVPHDPSGVVIFAHGSGSSRHSPRNKYVAQELNRSGFATLLLDLLTRSEEAIDIQTGEFRFNIDLLANRLLLARKWAAAQPKLSGLNIGYFGASTGAAAALLAASHRPRDVAAVVSRGGRPDLVEEVLPAVAAPTLLVVGGNDTQVLEMNRRAYTRLRGEKELAIIPNAGHLFEEPGALEKVAQVATQWFEEHLYG